MYTAAAETFVRQTEDTQLYQIITVDRDRLIYRAKKVTAELHDAFTLIKRPGRANELVDSIPYRPKNLRRSTPDAGQPPVSEPAAAVQTVE